tara:strand:- start:474 stop:689 length:216 start_codon:yes stop_codon:yes gene_type:complete
MVRVHGATESINELEEIELSDTVGDSKELQDTFDKDYGEFDSPEMQGLFADARKKVHHKMLNKVVVTNMKN